MTRHEASSNTPTYSHETSAASSASCRDDTPTLDGIERSLPVLNLPQRANGAVAETGRQDVLGSQSCGVSTTTGCQIVGWLQFANSGVALKLSKTYLSINIATSQLRQGSQVRCQRALHFISWHLHSLMRA